MLHTRLALHTAYANDSLYHMRQSERAIVEIRRRAEEVVYVVWKTTDDDDDDDDEEEARKKRIQSEFSISHRTTICLLLGVP